MHIFSALNHLILVQIYIVFQFFSSV